MHMARGFLLLSLVGLSLALAGCVTERVSASRLQASTLDKARGPEQNAKLYTDLIRKLIDQGRLYAALAHLQARERQFGRTAQLRLLRADILRKMGDDQAALALYEDLRDTRFAAHANHGMGLIVAGDDLARGTAYLQRAVEQRPTDARMRNDFGYALLRQGRMNEARMQLTTAYQLDEANQLSRNNYILLLLATGQTARAKRVAARNGLSAEVMAGLRRKAESLSRPVAATPVQASAMPADTASPRIGGGGG